MWNTLCENARLFGLNMTEFSKLESFFKALDPSYFSSCADKVWGEFPHEEVQKRFAKGELEKFYLLCIVINYQKAVEYYRSKGYPEEIMQDVLGDLRLWEPVFMRDLGFAGLSPRLFYWAQDCLNGTVKQFGRLQCNDIHLFALKLSLYRKNGGLQVLDAFEKSNPPSPDLTYGDKAISLHIPASGALKAADCMDSIRRMCSFNEKFHPDYDFKAVVCYSWLLDPQFQEFLPETSNILQFQKLGHLLVCPGRDETREVIWRIWGVPGLNMPLDKLPVRTSMEKGVVEFLKQGKRFREGLLVIFRDEL